MYTLSVFQSNHGPLVKSNNVVGVDLFNARMSNNVVGVDVELPDV